MAPTITDRPAMAGYGVEDDYWFSCAPTARKVRNLAANDRITVATEDPTRFVSVEGRAEKVEPGPRIEPVIDDYATKYAEFAGGTPEEFADFMAQTAFYRVTPERAFGIIETPEDFAKRATRWRWT